MKRTNFFVLVIFLTVLLVGSTVFGQLGIRPGVKVGYNWATLSGEGLNGVESRKSIAVGAGIELSFLGLLAVQADVLYSPRGTLFQNGSETRLNYLSIPIVIKKKFLPVGIHPFLLCGPEFSFLLTAKADDTDIKDQVKAQDLAIVVGGGVEFSLLGKSAYIEGRYSYGLHNINEEDAQPSSKNRVWQLFVGFLF